MTPSAAPALGAEGVVDQALPNGFRTLVRENRAEVVAMTLFVGVGSAHEALATNGVTALLGRSVLKGTRTRSAIELARAAEDAGGGLDVATDQEYSEVRAYGLGRHWRILLSLLDEVVTAPSLEAEEIERERDALAAQIRSLDDQPFAVANRVLSRALYGSHPYGFATLGELETVSRLTRADLVEHRGASYTPERMLLAVSGQVPAADLLTEAASRFGALARGLPEAPLASPPGAPATLRTHERRATQQTQLLLGLLAPPAGHPDFVPLKVLSALLGGGMSSRLFRGLRDEAGLAYAVGALYPTRQRSSRLVVHLGTAPENVALAEAGIRRELERLCEEPVSEEELEDAKTALTGALALDLRTNARRAFYLGFFELMGLGYAYVGRYPDAIEAVTGADLVRVARLYLTEPAVAIVGPD